MDPPQRYRRTGAGGWKKLGEEIIKGKEITNILDCSKFLIE